jgi:hypothetical protein
MNSLPVEVDDNVDLTLLKIAWKVANRVYDKYNEFRKNRSEQDEDREECILRVLDILRKESEIKKSKHIEKFAENTVMDPNCQLDNSTILFLLSTIEKLSWRQLCFIQGFIQHRSKEIEINPISPPSTFRNDPISELNYATRMSEMEQLEDLNCLRTLGERIFRYNRVDPDKIEVVSFGKVLSTLMELDTISDSEINKAFTLWGIKREHR